MPTTTISEQNLEDIDYCKYTNLQTWYNAINEQKGQLQIVHINVCSLRKHFEELIAVLKECLHNLDVICLTEINIKKDEIYKYRLEGFNVYTWTREERRGGGILLYVKSDYMFTPKKSPVLHSEILFGEVLINNYKVTLIIIYRPPDNNKTCYITELEALLQRVPKRENLIIIGDININILKNELNAVSRRYLNMLSDQGMQCGIQDVTRECVVAGRRVASCVDHVFLRTGAAGALHTFTVTHKVADHYITGMTADINLQATISLPRACLNNKGVIKRLTDTSWQELLKCNDPIEIYNSIVKIFDDIYEACTFQCTQNNKRDSQLWVNKNLQNELEKRDLLFRKWKSHPDNHNFRLAYTRHRNYTNKLIKKTKNEYQKKKIIDCNGDMRKIWNNINNWLGRNKMSVDSVIEKYMLQDKSKSGVSDGFCDTFTKEIENIKGQHQCQNLFLDRKMYVRETDVSFRFKKVQPYDVLRVIENMDCCKASGSDGVRVRDLKLVKHEISPVIAHFVNLSFKTGLYPNELKVAIIRPIYKNGSHKEFTNYRPIAILNVINKIVEKNIVSQITSFIENNQIISNVQHGFRPNRSTATALSEFVDYVNNALNEQKIVFAIFVDFKKAFDTLDHDGLLQSMMECGLRGPINTWFREYLRGRQLAVSVCGTKSRKGNIKYGVPTGSVYGPVGYIMHVNSMPNVIKKCKSFMYADDTCIVYSGTVQDRIQEAMQEDFDNVVRWAHDNGILINIDKTKCIPILSPFNKTKIINIKIKGHSYDCLHRAHANCNCVHIEMVQSYKYLGLIVDDRFSWIPHVDSVCNKLRSILGKLHYLKYMATRGTMYLVYHSLADAVISYGLGAYGLTFPVHLNKIKSLQIRILKLLVDYNVKKSLGGDYEKLFKLCKVLPVEYKLRMVIIMEQFGKTDHKHERKYAYQTRASKQPKLIVPKTKNYYGKRTRRWLTPVYSNELPHDLLHTVQSKKHLKSLLRRHYLSLCP